MKLDALFRVATMSDEALLALSRGGVIGPFSRWQAAYEAVVHGGRPLACLEQGEREEALALATITQNERLEVYPAESLLYFFRRENRDEAMARIHVLHWFQHSGMFSGARDYVQGVLLGYADHDIARYIRNHPLVESRRVLDGAREAYKSLRTCADGDADVTVELLDHCAWTLRLHHKEESDVQLEGTEIVGGTDARLQEFWRWAYSDLTPDDRAQALATFMVARALARPACRRTHRIEVDGVRLEVVIGRSLGIHDPEADNNTFFVKRLRRDLDLYVLARPRRVDGPAMLDAANWAFKLLPTTHPYLAGNRPVVLWKAVLEEVLTLEGLRATLDNAA